MGIIKEYVDRAVQTETGIAPSPYADPAVILAAPLATRGVAQEAHAAHYNSLSVSSPTNLDSANALSQSPTSPMFAPLVSRRISRSRPARFPTGEIANRRIVSMPENKSDSLHQSHSKRVVSMPDRVRPVLEPSAELFQSPTVAGDSFAPYGGRHDRVRVFCAPSDVPQTPSPPSSPESLLIIASGTQLPEGFLRRKYSPEPLIEEDEVVWTVLDWVTWANSPPRPIPALHGPLSLPYARCPSGAEGTIIEEPDNVAQMIWGLGPDDQPYNQIRAEGYSSHTDNHQNALSRGTGQDPPRLQKKKSSATATQQVHRLSRTQNPHSGHTKQSIARPQRQARDDKHSQLSLTSTSPDNDIHQDIISGLPRNEEQSTSINVGALDDFANDANAFPVDSNRILELQLARLRQALRTSLADMDPYATYPGRLEPVIPATVAPGLPQSYPRIFVEPRPNESAGSCTRQSPTDITITQQYRQQQLYWQALQKQKLQSLLPTPPNSSSPQWSSHFSPHLTYRSTFSPDLVGSAEHPVSVSSQKYWSGANAPQYLRHVYSRQEHDNGASNPDTNVNISSTKTMQVVPNINSAPSLRQSSYSSSTLAKYIKQLQALSPITQLSPLQPAPSQNTSLPLTTSANEGDGPFRTVHHSPVVPTPPSPESPKTLSRGCLYRSARPIASSHPVQRRLSSVPEEDSALLELSTSLSPSRLQNQVMTGSTASSRDGTTGRQIRYVDVAEFEGDLVTPSIALHPETSPVKVRLPATKERSIREQTSGYQEQEQSRGHQHGHRKKHRHKKPKGPATTNEQATARGLVG